MYPCQCEQLDITEDEMDLQILLIYIYRSSGCCTLDCASPSIQELRILEVHSKVDPCSTIPSLGIALFHMVQLQVMSVVLQYLLMSS